MRNSDRDKCKNAVVDRVRTCVLSSPSLWSRRSGHLLTGSSDVFAVQALVCIYSEFRACFHCRSKQTALPRAVSGQKHWDMALQTGLISQPCSNTAKGTNSPTVSSPTLLGAVVFLALVFLGCSSRAPAVLQMCSLLAAVSSWSGTTWPGLLVTHSCCLVPL